MPLLPLGAALATGDRPVTDKLIGLIEGVALLVLLVCIALLLFGSRTEKPQ